MKFKEFAKDYFYTRTMHYFTNKKGEDVRLVDLPTHEYVIVKGDEVVKRDANIDDWNKIKDEEGELKDV